MYDTAGFSPGVIDHATNPRNVGSIADADGFGAATRECGDTIEIWLKIRDGIVAKATFWTDGCGPVIACGSMATELLKEKTAIKAMRINVEDISAALGGLPKGEEHCAELAVSAIREAVRDYLAHKREPWKRLYRTR